MAQSVKHLTLDWSSGYGLRVLGSSPGRTGSSLSLKLIYKSLKGRKEEGREGVSVRGAESRFRESN